MSLTFIFGKPGAGKTTRCIDEILSRQRSSGEKAILYIVPEQFSLQSEKSIVKRSGGEGLYKASVTGFNRLAFTIFSETGVPDKKLLEDTGKNMLVRKILSELKNELSYYRTAYDKQGFVFEICAQITEFVKYSVTPEKLLTASESMNAPSREALKLKMLDLHRIYSLFRKYQQENYISGDETLDLLAEKIKYSKIIEGADIFIDGYKGFTPQEYKVLKALMLSASNIFITLTIDPLIINNENNREGIFFAETKQTWQKLCKIAGECGITIQRDIILDKPARFSKAGAIAHLRDYFFKNDIKSYGKECQCVRLYEAESKNDEIHNAARLIISLCRDGSELLRDNKYKYNEIAVMVNFLPDYDKSIKAVFSEYNIPVFIDSTDDILSHPLTEWLRALIAVSVTNWNYESVFRLLKTSLSPLSVSEIDLLENYALAYGIKGYKWKKPFAYGFGDENVEGRFNEAVLNELRTKVVTAAETFENKFNKKKGYSVKLFCEAVYESLIANKIPGKLSELIDKLNNNNKIESANSSMQIWDIIIDVLDKMAEILGDEAVTLSEFAKILESGLMSAKLGAAPPTLDQIVVGDLRRSRFSDIKALIILGANEGMMPSVIKDGGLLSGDEKEFLHKEKNIELAPTAISRTYEERFLIYCALAKPSEFLSVSYFKGGLDGKAYEPSYIIGKMKSILPVSIRKIADEQFTVAGVTVSKPVFSGLSGALRNFLEEDGIGIPDIYKDIYGYFKKNEYYSDRIKKWESIIESKGGEEKLSEDITDRLYGKRIKASVSKLEKYVECPYSYFLRYNLYAGERKLYELQSVDLGNIFHSALNRFAVKLKNDKREWRGIEEGELYAIADECVNQTLNEAGNEILKSSGQYSYFGERVKEITKKSLWALNEHMNRGGFTLTYSEAEFSEHSDGDGASFGAIRLPLDEGGEMVLEGKIDRIDMLDLEGNKYVKIMDYKSGKKKFLFAEAFYGLQLQLTLYLDSFIKKCIEEYGQEYADKIFPGAMLYFTLANPFIDIKGELSDKELSDELLKKYKMSGVILKDKEVIKMIDSEIGKTSNVIPVSMKSGKTSNGEFDGMEFSEAASVLPVESFLRLMDYTVKKAEKIGNEILSGRIDVSPYQFKKSTGCRFCQYKSVCCFDPSQSGSRYNKLSNINEKDAMLEITGTNETE